MSNKHLNGYVEEHFDDEIDHTDGIDTFTPVCPHCGAQRLPMGVYKSQAEANEDAAMSCNCLGAVEYRSKKEKAKQREDNLAALNTRLDELAKYCDERGVPICNETKQLLERGGTAVLDGQAGAIQCHWLGMKVKIKLNGKGKLQVRYSYTDTVTMEV